MTDEGAESKSETLEDLANDRYNRDLPTHVHVVGNFEHQEPLGREVAERVANVLLREGSIRTEDFTDLEAGDVAFVTVEDPPVAPYERRNQLQQLQAASRTKQLAGVVVFTEPLQQSTETLFQTRVWAQSGEVERVEELTQDRYDGDVYTIELEGITNNEQSQQGKHAEQVSWKARVVLYGIAALGLTIMFAGSDSVRPPYAPIEAEAAAAVLVIVTLRILFWLKWGWHDVE